MERIDEIVPSLGFRVSAWNGLATGMSSQFQSDARPVNGPTLYPIENLLRPVRLMNPSSRHTGNEKEMLVRFVGIRGWRVRWSWPSFPSTREPRVPTTNTKTEQLEITRSKCARYIIRAVLNKMIE